MFWLPRYYLTTRINSSKYVFPQPVNKAEETVRSLRFISSPADARQDCAGKEQGMFFFYGLFSGLLGIYFMQLPPTSAFHLCSLSL